MKRIYFHNGAVCVAGCADAGDGCVCQARFRFEIDGETYEVFRGDGSEGEYLELRSSFRSLSGRDWRAASKGAELMHWDSSVRFCAACGAPLERTGEICKRCPGCGKEYFPTLSPAAIVLVEKGDRALLVHARSFRRPFFGLVAGFVETGECLEETVAREVMEETSLEIDDIRYFGSQSWPFPSQLMVGFTAQWKSGEVAFADGELSDGGFFSASELPELPGLPSIARQMIDAWVERKGAKIK